MADVRGVKGPTAQDASRQFRKELFEQKLNVHRNKEALCDINSNRLDEAVKRLDRARERGEALGDGIQKSKDVSAQAEILRTLAGYGVLAANKLVQQQQGRGPMELIRALRAVFVHTGDPQLDGEEDSMAFCWGELAARTEHLRRPATGVHCMLGPMDAKAKERKAPAQRQRRTKETTEVVRPEELQEIKETDKQETDRNMEVMWGIIRSQPNPLVPMCELVCNHKSFAQTVENIFTLLFLVRDNRVAVSQDRHMGIMVRAVDARKPDNGGGGGSAGQPMQQQFVGSFNMDDWDVMCKLIKPSESLMPHREVPNHRRGQQQQEHADEQDASAEAGSRRWQPKGASGPPEKKQRR